MLGVTSHDIPKSVSDVHDLLERWRIEKYGVYKGNLDAHGRGITSLRGSPTKVVGYTNFSFNRLTSLEGIPEEIDGHLYLQGNKITSLRDIHRQLRKMNGRFGADQNPIKSHVLGLLLVEGILYIDLDNVIVEEILNRHLCKGRVGMLMAQEELIAAGLEDFAQL